MSTRHKNRLISLAAGAALVATLTPGAGVATAEAEPPRVLVFAKTAGYRHASITTGVQALEELGEGAGLAVDATEDAGAFTPENLGRYRAVVFLSTTGDVLDAGQQAAFESYISAGGGYAGVHAASDTEYDWPWYGGLVGAYFKGHPAIQPAVVRVADRAHASTAHLGPEWPRTDEWYNYRTNPRERVHVLAALDESTYSGGDMGDHPIAWCHDYAGGRSWYTGGGHTHESYAEPAFRAHLLGGLRYAAGLVQADCRPESGYTPLFDGTGTEGWRQAGPGGFTLADGTLTSYDGLGMLWYAAREFRSYSLKLDWRVAGDDNSGIFIGFPASDDPWSAVNNGYEVQIDATDAPDRTTGSVYGFQAADIAARDAALNPPGEWNTFELKVRGERLKVYLNGVKINDFTNRDPARSLLQGHVGIQNHGTGDDVSFRNIRIKESPARKKDLVARK
ncbi:ThuA domain-containing protein [Actinomadura alba]|uniref:ThuA domain-containing protein n=1 Tax=Actinomadura alba TaxID=406431 RepID=A0ABR7LYD0_9ACTN|nr:ThuA domain-containing protein [Actinomadura alba]MBC6469853.1 ThuA domain-containing protein [Actinomadura alba]